MKDKIFEAIGFIGLFLIIGAVSTMDYYTIELAQAEPTYLWVMGGIGAAMTAISFIRSILVMR